MSHCVLSHTTSLQCLCVGCRLVRTQVEMEMEMESTDGEPVDQIITVEEDEEVMLLWNSGQNQKGIRELAMAAAENIKEDKDIMHYYR